MFHFFFLYFPPFLNLLNHPSIHLSIHLHPSILTRTFTLTFAHPHPRTHRHTDTISPLVFPAIITMSTLIPYPPTSFSCPPSPLVPSACCFIPFYSFSSRFLYSVESYLLAYYAFMSTFIQSIGYSSLVITCSSTKNFFFFLKN